MNKVYEAPKMDLVELSNEDVVRTSDLGVNPTPFPGGDGNGGNGDWGGAYSLNN